MPVRLVEKTAPKVPVVALVPPELLERINQIAAREERSRSAVVAMALRDFVERDSLIMNAR
jgi:predicted transcriptional regulator